tara:strand:- start:1204 stop:1374 length:171 start_codon:yes stop_codon:yes gene_type:complete
MTHDKEMTGMCFDHSTQTSEFRDWICKKCNTLLGMLGDDNPQGAQQLVDYLKKHEE